jgi:hypothetical protein
MINPMHNAHRILVAALAAVGSAALLAATALADPQRIELAAGAAYTHAGTGMMFPEQLPVAHKNEPPFVRQSVTQFDDKGADISAKYLMESEGIVASVFVYPAAAAMEEEFEKALSAVRNNKNFTDQTLVSLGEFTFDNNGRTRQAQRGIFDYTGGPAGQQTRIRGEVILTRVGDYYVRYRISYSAEHADHAATHSLDVLKNIALPR